MRRTRAQLDEDNEREIRDKKEYHSINPDTHAQINENIQDSYLHLDEFEAYTAGNPGGGPGSGGSGVLRKDTVAGLKAVATNDVAQFPSATPAIVASLNRLYLLRRTAGLTEDSLNVINSSTAGHQWVEYNYGLTTGASSNMPFKVAVWTTATAKTTYSLDELGGVYPDIRVDSPIYLNYEVIQAPNEYSYNARTVTIPSGMIVPGEKLILTYWTGSAGGTSGGGGGGSGNVTVEPDGVDAQILVRADVSTPGVTKYFIKADPKLVTNTVNASGNALPDEIMLSTNNTGDEIKSSGHIIYGVLPGMDTVAKTPTSPGIGGLLSVQGGFLYFCITDNVWGRVAIQTGW